MAPEIGVVLDLGVAYLQEQPFAPAGDLLGYDWVQHRVDVLG